MDQKNSTADDSEYVSIAELENLLPKIVAAHDLEKKKRKWWMAGTFIAALVFGAGGIGVTYHVTAGQQEELRGKKSRLFEENKRLKTTTKDLEKKLKDYVEFVEGIGNVVYPTLSAIFDHSFKPTIELCSLNQDNKAPYFRCEEGKAEIKKQVGEYQKSGYPSEHIKVFANGDTSPHNIVSKLGDILKKMVEYSVLDEKQKEGLRNQLGLLEKPEIYFKRTGGGEERIFTYKKPAEGVEEGTLGYCNNGKTELDKNPASFFVDNARYTLLEGYECKSREKKKSGALAGAPPTAPTSCPSGFFHEDELSAKGYQGCKKEGLEMACTKKGASVALVREKTQEYCWRDG